MARRRFLTDAMWEKIQPLLPKIPPSLKGGRPRKPDREVLEGILWILRTGAAWVDLPQEYPSPTTCWRRLQAWEKQGVWLTIWRAFLGELDSKGALDWQEAFLDGSFAPAKGGAKKWVKPSVGRVQSGWWWSTARVFLWEANLPRHRPRRSPSPRRPSTASRLESSRRE
jgi:transposase